MKIAGDYVYTQSPNISPLALFNILFSLQLSYRRIICDDQCACVCVLGLYSVNKHKYVQGNKCRTKVVNLLYNISSHVTFIIM